MKLQKAPLSTDRQLTRLDSLIPNKQLNSGKQKTGQTDKDVQKKSKKAKQEKAVTDINANSNQIPQKNPQPNKNRCKWIFVCISYVVIFSCSITVLILSVKQKRDGFLSVIQLTSFPPSGASDYLKTKYFQKNYAQNLKFTSLVSASCVICALIGIVLLISRRVCQVFISKRQKQPEQVIKAQTKQSKYSLLNKTVQAQILDKTISQKIKTKEYPNKKQDAFPTQEQEDLISGIAKFLILMYSWILLGLIVALGHHLSFFLDSIHLNYFDIDKFKLQFFIGLQALSLVYTSVVYAFIIHQFRANQSSSSQNQEKQNIPLKLQVQNEKNQPKQFQIIKQPIKKDKISLVPKQDQKKGAKFEFKPQKLVQNTKKTTKQNPKDVNKPVIDEIKDLKQTVSQKIVQQKNEKPKQGKKNQAIPNDQQRLQQSPSKNSIIQNPKLTKEYQKLLTVPASASNQPQIKIISPKLNESPTVINLNPCINSNYLERSQVKGNQLPTAIKVTNNSKEEAINLSKLIYDEQEQIVSSSTKDDGINNHIHKVNDSLLAETIGKDSALKKQTPQLSKTADKIIDQNTNPPVVQRIRTKPQPFVLKPLVDLPKQNKIIEIESFNQDKGQISESLTLAANSVVQNKLDHSNNGKSVQGATKNQHPQKLEASTDQANDKTDVKQNLIPRQENSISMPIINKKSERKQISHTFCSSNPHEQVDFNRDSKIDQNQQRFPKNGLTIGKQLIHSALNPSNNRKQPKLLEEEKDSVLRILRSNQNANINIYRLDDANPFEIHTQKKPQTQHQQNAQKNFLANQQPSKKKLSFCSGIYSIEQSSPFSSMVFNVFKSKSYSKPHSQYEDIRINTFSSNQQYYNNKFPQTHQIRQQERFQTNRARKFDVQNQVQTSPIAQRFSPTNKKVVIPQQHNSSQKFFKYPQVQVPKDHNSKKYNQKPIPERRFVPLKQQVYDPYGYESREQNTSSQISSYQSGAQFYHQSIKRQINKSGNRIWNHSTTYSTDNELVKRKHAKFEEKSSSSGTQIGYYDDESLKKKNKKGQQSQKYHKNVVDLVKNEQLNKIKQEQAKIQQIYLESQRRIQKKINMLNASIQQKEIDSKIIEQSIKFMNQPNFNSVLIPVIDQNKKIRITQQQQKIEDERRQQERERQLKLKQEKTLKLRQQKQIKEKQRISENQRKLSSSREDKQPILGRKRESSKRDLVREQSRTRMDTKIRKRSKQVSRQTFSNGEPSIIVNKQSKGSSDISSNEEDPLPTKQQLQNRYLQRLRQLGDVQNPSLNAYMERVMYKRRNSENNFHNNGFEPVEVKVETSNKQKQRNSTKNYLNQKNQLPEKQYKKLDFVLLTPESINKNRQHPKK